MDNKYLTVSALTSYIKRKFDADPHLQKIYLEGEISNFRSRPNSHQYFSLKDEQAKINVVMFKSNFSQIKFQPEEGMKVLVTGRISVYPGNGGYQIYLDSMQPDGVGALYQAYEQLKKRLTEEGLFSAEKRLIPKYPKRVAVITSPSGAVIRDIITTIKRRYPIAQIVLFPAVVQGDQSAGDLVKQIKNVNAQSNFDTLIIGRGGGSIEDLWPFNEEIVVRAIFDSKIPVISSVGHETDTTITDLVADIRAATPTAAAEIATPVLTDEIFSLEQSSQRLKQSIKHLLVTYSQRLESVKDSYLLKDPTRLYEGYLQKLDILNQRMLTLYGNNISNNYRLLEKLIRNLNQLTPLPKLQMTHQKIKELEQRQIQEIQHSFMQYRTNFTKIVELLNNLSPLKIMSRGYAYVTSENGIIKSSKELKVGSEATLNFSDGRVQAQITGKEENENG